MSKGGAGKVYFVLYLAVILELLIIFIERDEAEEGLRKQQRQALQIVQTILSQLQSGTGATGITATPKDNIVLNDKEPQSTVRNYTVVVAVGDPKAASVMNGKTIRGDDVSKLVYTVSHLGNPEIEEIELGPDSADITNGNKIFEAELGTDVGSYTTPRQTFGSSIPADVTDKYFTLNEELTNEQVSKGRRVKVFGVNFKPNQGAGWYRLRFSSATNKILGVTGEPKDADTVRIGNIKLTVLQLRQVQKVLRKERGAEGQATQVERYVDQLLTPDAYKQLGENQGFTSFNVRVTRPDLPPPQQPFATISVPRDTIYWYNAAPFSVRVTLGPKEATKDVSGATLAVIDQEKGSYNAVFSNLQPGLNKLTAKAVNAGNVASDEKFLMVDAPELKAKNDRTNGTKAWRGMRAVVGAQYDPSSDWASLYVPDDHYQTVVEMKGVEVLNRPGVAHRSLPAEQAKSLVVTEGTRPADIKTSVFWKPGGTPDRSQWVLLLSNQGGTGAIVQPEGEMSVSFPMPQLVAESFDYNVTFSPRIKMWTSPQFSVIQRIGNVEHGVPAVANCAECDKDGLNFELEQIDDKTAQLKLAATDFTRLLKNKEANGKKYEVEVTLRGKGGATRSEVLTFTLTVSPR